MSGPVQPVEELGIRVGVNGVDREARVEARLLLVHLVREVFGLTATHIGCDTGHCGTCTLLLDGTAVRSCMVLAVQANGRQLLTPEGLARGDQMHPIQAAFWEGHGLACGYCTPGMVLTAYSLLQGNPDPSEAEIRSAVTGVLCRCMNYTDIVNSIANAARKVRGEVGS